jgi:hypothetical protein
MTLVSSKQSDIEEDEEEQGARSSSTEEDSKACHATGVLHAIAGGLALRYGEYSP